MGLELEGEFGGLFWIDGHFGGYAEGYTEEGEKGSCGEYPGVNNEGVGQ
jgi:hypothetical protein